MLNTPITFFRSITSTVPTSRGRLKDLFTILQKESPLTDELRNAALNNPEDYNSKKKKLPGLVLGDFSKRNQDSCQTYSPILGFDIDKISSEDHLKSISKIIAKLPYILACFPSASGLGLRLLIATTSTSENHTRYYSYILEKLKTDLKDINDIHLDIKTKDISRLWFYSPLKKGELYLNQKSDVVNIEEMNSNQDTQSQGAQAPSLTEEKKHRLAEEVIRNRNINGRNNYVMEYTRLAAEFGISLNFIQAEMMKLEEKGFEEKEILSTTKYNFGKCTSRYEDLQILKYSNSILGHEVVESIVKNKKIKTPKKTPINTTEDRTNKNQYIQIRDYIFDKYDLRKNEISLDVEIREKSKPYYEILNDANLTCELLENNFTRIESSLKAILNSDQVERYNPLRDYLNTLPKWDESKPDYIGQLSSYVVAKKQDWFNRQFKKMIVRNLACSLGIIPFNKQCFTIIGNQNDGKTTFLRFLCPPILKDYYTENITLDKDGKIALATNLFINLDEIATIPYNERNKIKSLLSQEYIKERPPYGSKAIRIKRIANFMASTNEKELLTDDTGNVRWIIFEIESINHDRGGSKGYSKNIDIDNVYSQSNYLLTNGFKFELTVDEIKESENYNSDYVKSFVELDLIQKHYLIDPNNKDSNFKTNADIMQELMTETYSNIKLNPNMIGKALKHIGVNKTSKYFPEIRHSRKGYFVERVNFRRSP